MINPIEYQTLAWRIGYLDFWFGGDIDDCKYQAGTWKESERREGWRAAEQINEENKVNGYE